MLALFVPRRRMWVKATADGSAVSLEYAGLARGEDPTIAIALDDLVSGHERLLDADGRTVARATDETDTALDDNAADADPAASGTPKVD